MMMMLDPVNDLLPPPSSPTISSVSSSDLDTESTGSFFHDRSTTLGTLMGVTFPAITFRPPSRSHSQHRQFQPTTSIGPSAVTNRTNKKSKKNRATAAMAGDEEERSRWRRRRWWRLCRDDCDCRPASLGEFLEAERRFGDGAAFYGGGGAAAELEGVVGPVDDHSRNGPNGRVLFADGRVLPPAEIDEAAATGGLCRFSVVSLSGICSGGAVG